MKINYKFINKFFYTKIYDTYKGNKPVLKCSSRYSPSLVDKISLQARI